MFFEANILYRYSSHTLHWYCCLLAPACCLIDWFLIKVCRLCCRPRKGRQRLRYKLLLQAARSSCLNCLCFVQISDGRGVSFGSKSEEKVFSPSLSKDERERFVLWTSIGSLDNERRRFSLSSPSVRSFLQIEPTWNNWKIIGFSSLFRLYELLGRSSPCWMALLAVSLHLLTLFTMLLVNGR